MPIISPESLQHLHEGQIVPIHEHDPFCSTDTGIIIEYNPQKDLIIRCTKCRLPVFIDRGPVRHFRIITHS